MQYTFFNRRRVIAYQARDYKYGTVHVVVAFSNVPDLIGDDVKINGFAVLVTSSTKHSCVVKRSIAIVG